MKTNFFKIVLPAFALMLAITASLAFTPVEEDHVPGLCDVTEAFYQNPDANVCQEVLNIECDIADQGLGFCTIQVGPFTKRLYLKTGITTGPCNVPLYKCAQE